MAKKTKHLWLQRDYMSYFVSKNKGDTWGDGFDLRPCESPVKLKPGDKPVKVRLVVDK